MKGTRKKRQKKKKKEEKKGQDQEGSYNLVKKQSQYRFFKIQNNLKIKGY